MTASQAQTLSEVVTTNIMDDTKDAKPSSTNSWWCNEWRKLLAEFLCTLILIMFGCSTSIHFDEPYSAVASSLAFGIIVMFNVQIFGHISGAFMNPVITLSAMIFGSVSIPLGIAYMVSECLGAIAGYGILDAITSMDLVQDAVCVAYPLAGQSKLQTLGIEVAITVALILFICSLWDPINYNQKETASIKIGLTVVGLSLVSGPFTGTGMNPARSLGPAVWTNVWTDHWIYWVGPLGGSAAATYLYKYVFLSKPRTD